MSALELCQVSHCSGSLFAYQGLSKKLDIGKDDADLLRSGQLNEKLMEFAAKFVQLQRLPISIRSSCIGNCTTR
jgi:hypothetical protein